MKKLLYVDCNLRGERSRTRRLAEAFLAQIDREKYEVERVDLTEIRLSPMDSASLALRDELLARGCFDHEMFRYARQFADADVILVAAPFWDLGFPAQLKIYLENVSVNRITFGYNEQGMVGLCRGTDLVFVTTRGGIYGHGPLECGSSYMRALTELFGIDHYHSVCAEGLDIMGSDVEGILQKAEDEAAEVAGKL